MRRDHRTRRKGQALVELALVFPMLTVMTFGVLQLVILFLTYLSVMSAARDLARWVTVHPHTVDSTAVSALGTRLPPNINSANLTVTIAPACASLTSGKCSGRDSLTRMTFTLAYNAASIILLPTSFGCCGFVIEMPTSLPSYTLYMMVEPT